MLPTIEEGIVHWAADIRVLLHACGQLVEYYGTEEEEDSFRASVAGPLWFIEALKQVAVGVDVDTTKGPDFARFSCSQKLASMITPLARIVVEWQPDFVADAQDMLEEEERRKVMIPYGQFLGTTGMYLCSPMWTAYPALAPPGWDT